MLLVLTSTWQPCRHGKNYRSARWIARTSRALICWFDCLPVQAPQTPRSACTAPQPNCDPPVATLQVLWAHPAGKCRTKLQVTQTSVNGGVWGLNPRLSRHHCTGCMCRRWVELSEQWLPSVPSDGDTASSSPLMRKWWRQALMASFHCVVREIDAVQEPRVIPRNWMTWDGSSLLFFSFICSPKFLMCSSSLETW